MTDTERNALIGFGLACLLSGALTGRARSALQRYTRTIAPAAQIRTTVVPTGLYGSLVGRASLAVVEIEGGEINRLETPIGEPTSPIRVHVRRSELRASRSTALGLPVRRLRVVQADSVLDGARLIVKRDLRLVRAGMMAAEVVIDANQLARIVERRVPTVSDVHVLLSAGRICIRGLSSVPRGAITVVARAAVHGGDQIVLRDGRLWVDGNEVPGALAAALLGSLNPVFSLKEALSLGESVVIREVMVSEGIVRVLLESSPWHAEGKAGYERRH